MRVYTLIPRVSGYIEEWGLLVPHIAQLGFDTIHLLPFMKMGSSRSPYSSTNPYVIDPCFHPSANSDLALRSFQQFVQVLKDHKIKLCIDIVLNHLSNDSPLLTRNPEWYIQDEGEADGMKRAGWHDGTHWHKWEDLVALDYEHTIGTALWDYMLHYLLFWAKFASETDGYLRLDNLHSSHPEFVEFALSQTRQRYPNIQLLAELFADEHAMLEIIHANHISFLQGTQWEHKFMQDIQSYLQYMHSDKIPVRYLCSVLSHDSNSIIEEYGSPESLIPRLGISTLLSSGDWGIVQGIEYALREKIAFIGNPAATPWHLLYKNTDCPHKKIIATLNSLITEYQCFQEKGNITFIHFKHQEILSAVRQDPVHPALVCINLDVHTSHSVSVEESLLQELKLSVPQFLHNILSNKKIKSKIDRQTDKKTFVIPLAPGELFVHIF